VRRVFDVSDSYLRLALGRTTIVVYLQGRTENDYATLSSELINKTTIGELFEHYVKIDYVKATDRTIRVRFVYEEIDIVGVF
jgi:3'-phosphoadenosine 5'-phosphosulfate sulfotransferase